MYYNIKSKHVAKVTKSDIINYYAEDKNGTVFKLFNSQIPTECPDDLRDGAGMKVGIPVQLVETTTGRFYLDRDWLASFRKGKMKPAEDMTEAGLESGSNEDRKYLQNSFTKHMYDNGHFNNVKALVGGYNADLKLTINCGYDNFGHACGLDFLMEECPDQEASFRNSVRQLTGSALFASSLRFEWGCIDIDGQAKPVCKIHVTMDLAEPLLINGSSLYFRSSAATVELTNADHIKYLRDPRAYIAIANKSINS